MNVYDLQLMFEDKAGPLMGDTVKAFKTSEMERFLNIAQNIYMNRLAVEFEINETARRNTTNLVESESLSPVTNALFVTLSSSSVLFDLKNLTKGVVKKIVEEQVIDSDGNRVRIKPVTHDQYLANVKNPYKKPYELLVWRVDVEDRIELIPSAGLSVASYELRYLRNPTAISFGSLDELELLDDALERVVDIAVNLALRSIMADSQQSI